MSDQSRSQRPDVTSELERELGGPGWMYPWRLTDEVSVPIAHPELPGIHATRERLVASVAEPELRNGGAVLDLGAHEGWFAQRALAWGADRVLAVDVRDINVRRASLLRDHFQIGPERMSVLNASAYDVDPDDVGRFDVVLVLGLIYHLEDPIGALRVAAALTAPGGLVVVEAQLHQGGPVRAGRGVTGEHTGEPAFTTEPAVWAAKYESPEEQENTPLAAYGGVISLIPNEPAVRQALNVIGLLDARRVEPDAADNVQYRAVDRAVFTARAPG